MQKKRTAFEAGFDVRAESCLSHTKSYDEELDQSEVECLCSPRQSPSLRVQQQHHTKRGVARIGRHHNNNSASKSSNSIHVSLVGEARAFDASDLSPLKIGPLTSLHRNNNGGVCQLFANFIVGSVAHRCEHDESGSTLTHEFFLRRESLFASRVARRTKFKEETSDIDDRRPLALIWTDPETGEISRITEITAIKTLLVELYLRLVVNSEKFQNLLRLMAMGFDLTLTGETDAVPTENETLRAELWKGLNWEAVLAQKLNESVDFV